MGVLRAPKVRGNVILGLLLGGPATLYALTKQFERGIFLVYSASLRSLRAAVTELLMHGFETVALSPCISWAG